MSKEVFICTIHSLIVTSVFRAYYSTSHLILLFDLFFLALLILLLETRNLLLRFLSIILSCRFCSSSSEPASESDMSTFEPPPASPDHHQ